MYSNDCCMCVHAFVCFVFFTDSFNVEHVGWNGKNKVVGFSSIDIFFPSKCITGDPLN